MLKNRGNHMKDHNLNFAKETSSPFFLVVQKGRVKQIALLQKLLDSFGILNIMAFYYEEPSQGCKKLLIGVGCYIRQLVANIHLANIVGISHLVAR